MYMWLFDAKLLGNEKKHFPTDNIKTVFQKKVNMFVVTVVE